MTHAELLASLSAARALTDIGRSLRESFYMFWETLWALVLGFGLSGAIQAFVSKDAMRRRLGDHRPASIARASFYGAASSSCSYAAAAVARSLFAGGADFLASMVFMFASTNLVVELGIVLVVLIGWQFLAAEFVGGVIMIVLLVIAGGLWFRGRALDEARQRNNLPADGEHRHGDGRDRDDGRDRSGDWQSAEKPRPGGRLRSGAAWADAAGYTMADLKMMWKEIAFGFVAAGLLAVLVPASVWNSLFLHGHGVWTSLENAAVGPLVAVISFVCSVGNVALAAALWKGGITFGGVVSFVFADLITLPLLLVYRKQYGGRMALRILVAFWAVMSATGLATAYLFRALGWLPATHPQVIASDTFRFGYVTVLDVMALAVFAVLYWLHRNRERLGHGSDDPHRSVCAMHEEQPASRTVTPFSASPTRG